MYIYICICIYIYILYIYIIIYSYGPIYRWFTSDWPIQIVGYWNPMGFPTLRHRKSPSPSHRWIDLWCFIFTLGAAASGLELRLNSLVWGARAGRLLGTVLRGKKMGGTKNSWDNNGSLWWLNRNEWDLMGIYPLVIKKRNSPRLNQQKYGELTRKTGILLHKLA